ncbi:Oidioi.mRNA.OKI2018_I69.chr2.g7556.t1.cds [Oikopleura dioica]|uniref:Oidioi.mRNA.OKI2018_I69.chr2.g7556.t1.cds n=1 Tax=Oikopleura dioica TaxID=34765 RepID=A0ABN7TA55_OIKDI|nr:Oidioi.mRNA.OKI2018_I69.chr2.g7556.t1.cds [Oikopleura dioica]
MELVQNEFFVEEKFPVKPKRAQIETLTARAAKFSYFSIPELRYLLQTEDFNAEETTVTDEEYCVVQPLLKNISGRISVCYNQELGGFVIIFQVFDELWISFRGTNSRDFADGVKDIQTDLKVSQVQPHFFPKVNVHRGFAESYATLRDYVWYEVENTTKINAESRRMTRIRILGHSLGGALATICAADIRFNAYQKSANHYKPSINGSIIKVSCRTFGSPAVGDAEFANFFNNEVKDSIRYAIKFDPVTLCLSPLKEYSHVAHYLEMGDIIGKHKIEYYVAQLEEWHKTRKVSEISIEEEHLLMADTQHDDNSGPPKIIIAIMIGISLFLWSRVFSRYKRPGFNIYRFIPEKWQYFIPPFFNQEY